MSRPRQLSKSNYFVLFMPDTVYNSRIKGMLSNEYPIRRISTTMWKFSDEEAKKLFEKRTKKAKAAAKLSDIDFSDWNQINDFIQDGCEKLNWEYVVFLEHIVVVLMDCLESTFLINETFRNELNFSENDKTDEMKFFRHFFDYLEPRIKATRYDYGFDLKPTRSFINDVSIIIDKYKLYCERTENNDESELSVCRDIEDHLRKEGKVIKQIRHDFRSYNSYFEEMEAYVNKSLQEIKDRKSKPRPTQIFRIISIYDDEQGLKQRKQGLKQRIEEMGDFRISADLRVHLLKTCYQEALKFIS